MNVVVDSSVAAKWVFPEPDSAAAMAIVVRYQAGEITLIAPDLIVAEVANIAWKKCVLRKEITADEARRAVAMFMAASPDLVPSTVLWEQALVIAATHKRPVYDCLYIALALQQRCDFVTADSALVKSLGPVFGCLSILA